MRVVVGWLVVGRRLLVVGLVVGLLAATASPRRLIAQAGAPPTPPKSDSNGTFGALKWRNIGPPRGGRSIAAEGSVARPYEYYMGATGGGLWNTADGRNDWKPVTDGQIHYSSVGAIAISPTNPDIVYIGTGE